MDATTTCRNCGSDIGPAAPFGHCAKCLLSLGFLDEQPAAAEVAASEWRIGDYELLGQIGRGGMGAVYRARQIGLNREVAFKMILPADSAQPEAIKRFRIEAEAAAKLHHPNIVPIYEIGREGSQHYFAMQLIDGENLRQCFARFQMPRASSLTNRAESRKAQVQIARLLSSIAGAVHFAHQRGVLHRDLKPQNILIGANGEPYLTDFGLAKILDDDESITERMTLLGTLNYMAPEQAAGARVGRAADVFSLGAILYELLTGTPPFRGVTPAETLRFIAEKEPIQPQMFNKWVDADLAVICLKCLQKKPHERYVSAGELAEDLERWLRDEPILARPVSRYVQARRWARRNRLLSGLVAAVIAIAALGAWHAFDWWRTQEIRREFAIDFVRKLEALHAGLVSSITLSPTDLAAATGERVKMNPRAQQLKVGIYTELDQVITIEQVAPFLRRVERSASRHLGRPVQIDLYLFSKRELLELPFLEERIDIIRAGEGPLVRLRRINNQILPLVEQVGGGKTSAIFVATSSPITNLAGLKGCRFAAGNPTSTSSGYKLFEVLLEAGLHAENLALTNHPSTKENPRLVDSGKFEAGVAQVKNVSGTLTNNFRILKQFLSATMPWASRAKLDPAIGRAFTAALVEMKDPRILENLPDDATQGFKPADTNYFLRLDKEMRRVEEAFFGPGGNPAEKER